MSTTEKPSPWPGYPERQLVLDGNIVVEVERRITEICALYEIDQQDPSWERLLLITLLARHVPNFWIKRKKGKSVDGAFLIETIETLRDFHEEKSGIRPSIDAVIQQIVDTPAETNPFREQTHKRMMRIYSGRKKEISTVYEDVNRDMKRVTENCEGHLALRETPESFAALLFKVIRARHE